MKERVLRIVEAAAAGANDNLYRATLQFGGMSQKELGEEYGESGKTCGELYEEYQAEVAEMDRCVAWVESAT